MDKTFLVILDGFGLNYNREQNPVLSANTPNLDSLIANHPFTTLSASGEEVGLSWGEVGNSEVGHFNLGTGQVLWQNLPKIDQSIRDGSFYKNKILNELIDGVVSSSKALHLIGLVSNGGIHSHINHLYALLKLAKSKNIDRVYIHMISDGRDTPPKSGVDFLAKLNKKIAEIGVGKVSTITGRKIAMDRNNNWERTKRFYETVIGGNSNKEDYFSSPEDLFEARYGQGKNDENLSPSIVDLSDNDQFVKEGDGVIIFNFRADRARQMTRALADPSLKEFVRAKFPKVDIATMTPYEEDWDIDIRTVFDPPKVEDNLPSVIDKRGLSQIHLAESEKRAHVTYFFGGGLDKKYAKEVDSIISSPDVESYDQKPEMSLEILFQAVVDGIKQSPEFILLNIANPDMVGHTGSFEATKEAVEAVDYYLGKLLLVAGKADYLSFVTADHGNCEQMINLASNKPDKEHTVNPVPFFWVDGFQQPQKNLDSDSLWQSISQLSPSGILADVSSTILVNLEIDSDPNMAGEDLKNGLVKL